MSWLRNAIHQAVKPQHSVIGVLKQNLGGTQRGRSMKVLHASDVTKFDFCPRKWALFDLFDKDPASQFVATAMDVTFQLGLAIETMLIEEWAGDAVVGNWRCRWCGQQRTMVPKPDGYCITGGTKKHWWQHMQLVIEVPTHGMQGAPDALFNIGAPQLVTTEIKIMAPAEFDDLLAPLPEHRLRTTLYLWMLEHSQHPYRDKINLQECRVLYVSRGYGKMNAAWNEVLPFKEFVVKRNDLDLNEFITRAAALKAFRTIGLMPQGICSTALEKIAKQCSVKEACFSGQYPAGKYPQHPEP